MNEDDGRKILLGRIDRSPVMKKLVADVNPTAL
jgi:hypothetical protein